MSHKNKNNTIGNFGIYEIIVNDETYKIGKTDLDRVTESSGDPTRLHQQVRKLREIYGENSVDREVIQKLFNVSTQEAKEIERAYLQTYYETTGQVPEGNKKSFKP